MAGIVLAFCERLAERERARPRRLRRVPRPRRGAARAEGARAVPGRGRRARRARAGGGGRGAGAPARRVPAGEGRRPAWLARAARGRARPLLPARAGAARAAGSSAGSRRSSPSGSRSALRLLARRPPPVSLAHLELRFPPVDRSSSSGSARCSRRRRRFDFDAEVGGLSRIEQAVALLALLELRKSGEVAIEQAAPFAPIRVSRAEDVDERRDAWTARSA